LVPGVGAHPGRVGRWTGGLGQEQREEGEEEEEERERVRFGRGVRGGVFGGRAWGLCGVFPCA